MADRYQSFVQLAQEKQLGRDYSITAVNRGSLIVVLAPHGGKIEPYTSELASLIAGEDYSLYCFEGRQGKNNFTHLHITSHRFDEPKAVALVESAAFSFAVHGHGSTDAKFVMTGGGNTEWETRTASVLSDAGFAVRDPAPGLGGRDNGNICNRGARGPGVQIEVSRAQRDELRDDETRKQVFVTAVRSLLAEWSQAAGT